MSWLIICLPIILIAYLGVREKSRNQANIEKIPLRINVNGIRGKSTVTRLTFSILREAGYEVIGKTTGSATRMLFWDQEAEECIDRPPAGPSIKEQVRVIDRAAKYGAKALVCECMAVRPEYQDIYQNVMFKAQLTVIVNTLKDHLDEMGPTTTQIAWAFAKSIPENGILIVPEDEFTDYYSAEAEKLGSRVISFAENRVPEALHGLIAKGIFPANCAAALAVAKALEIPEDVAIRGILKAAPDPGAMRIQEISSAKGNGFFVNAFAANEPESSLKIWDLIGRLNLPLDNPLILFNTRADRVDRTRLFAKDFFPLLPEAEVVVIGESAKSFIKEVKRGRYPKITRVYDLTQHSTAEIAKILQSLAGGRTIFAVGNLHGAGEEVIMELAREGNLMATDRVRIKEAFAGLPPSTLNPDDFRTSTDEENL
ncbi:MAG: poly-gamma-glutamate synthase PgsB [Eubacteriales bacterium]|nr:poly-gamma-glutamate synthase PgsB [Eubacteriales bacterium]